MQQFPFGGAFTYIYYPLVNGEKLNPPTQSPTVYLFDSLPSDAVAQAGTGALQTVSSWTESVDYQRSISFAAVADPDDGTREKSYWIAINYIAITSGSSTLDIEELKLVRPEGANERYLPTFNEVKAEDTNIESYYSDADIINYIEAAKTRVLKRIDPNVVQFEFVDNVGDLRICILYKALALMWFRQIVRTEDRFYLWAMEAEEVYKLHFNQIKLSYDANFNDTIEPDEVNRVQTIVRLVK